MWVNFVIWRAQDTLHCSFEVPEFGCSIGCFWLIQLVTPYLGTIAVLAPDGSCILGFATLCRWLIRLTAACWGRTNVLFQQQPSGHFLIILLFWLSVGKKKWRGDNQSVWFNSFSNDDVIRRWLWTAIFYGIKCLSWCEGQILQLRRDKSPVNQESSKPFNLLLMA